MRVSCRDYDMCQDAKTHISGVLSSSLQSKNRLPLRQWNNSDVELRWFEIQKNRPKAALLNPKKCSQALLQKGKNRSQAIFTTADLLESANTSRSSQRQYTSRDHLCNLWRMKNFRALLWKSEFQQNVFLGKSDFSKLSQRVNEWNPDLENVAKNLFFNV